MVNSAADAATGDGARAYSDFAPAKINLALHVTGRGADGYHLLDSLVAFADVGDRLTLRVIPGVPVGVMLTLSGPMAAGLTATEDNLVLRAATAKLPESLREGLLFDLEKHLPIASGIGGGSADAASALRLIARHHAWDPADPTIRRAALGLGADIPVCLTGVSARVQGIGELLTPVAVPRSPVLLVNPGIEVATPAVFKVLRNRENPPLPAPPGMGFSTAGQLIDWLTATRNDLEPPAIQVAPVIADVLATLRDCDGCALARMSGSGATCFGLFETGRQCRTAADGIARAHPDYWLAASRLR